VSGTGMGLELQGTGLVQRNVIRSGPCTSGGSQALGMSVWGAARFENNVVVADACTSSVGLQCNPQPNGPGESVFANNHIEGSGGANVSASRGVTMGSTGAITTYVFLNNTLRAGSGSTSSIVFEESSSAANPRLLANNNLFGATTLYHENSGTNRTTPAS